MGAALDRRPDVDLDVDLFITHWIAQENALYSSLLTDLEGGEDAHYTDGNIGFRNLNRLITDAIFDGMHYRPRIDWDRLKAHREGLICMTSGLNGLFGQALRDGERGEAQAHADLSRLLDIFGPQHLFVELQDFGIPGQERHVDLARRTAAALDVPTVVTNDSRYLRATDAVTLDLLNCVARTTPLDAPNREALPTDQQFLKTEAEMRLIFPDDGAALERTVEVARRCRSRLLGLITMRGLRNGRTTWRRNM